MYKILRRLDDPQSGWIRVIQLLPECIPETRNYQIIEVMTSTIAGAAEYYCCSTTSGDLFIGVLPPGFLSYLFYQNKAESVSVVTADIVNMM